MFVIGRGPIKIHMPCFAEQVNIYVLRGMSEAGRSSTWDGGYDRAKCLIILVRDTLSCSVSDRFVLKAAGAELPLVCCNKACRWRPDGSIYYYILDMHRQSKFEAAYPEENDELQIITTHISQSKVKVMRFYGLPPVPLPWCILSNNHLGSAFQKKMK